MDHKNNRFIKIKKGMGKSFLMNSLIYLEIPVMKEYTSVFLPVNFLDDCEEEEKEN